MPKNYWVDFKIGKGYLNKNDALNAAIQYRKKGYYAKISPRREQGYYYVFYKKKNAK